MNFITVDHKETLTQLIMQRQHKTTIDGIEIILPKQPYRKMTYKQRLKDAQQRAEKITKLLN